MLQKSLNHVIQRVCLLEADTVGAGAASLLSPLGQNSPFHPSNQITLHLRRQVFPLEYVTPLALQLASQTGRPVKSYTEQLAEELLKLHTSTELPADTAQFDPMSTGVQGIAPVIYTTGQLGLQLNKAAMTRWVNCLSQAMTWPAPVSLTTPQRFTVKNDRLSRSLGLSPLAFMQHLHARSTTLLTLIPDGLPQPRPGKDPAIEFSGEENPTVEPLAIHGVIWALAHLTDGLYETRDPSVLAQRGYTLSEAAYTWFRSIHPSSLTIFPPTTLSSRTLLQAIRQSLKYILEVHLGHLAPEHF